MEVTASFFKLRANAPEDRKAISYQMAHRMHACVAAHSFAIPTIGLRWDVKLDSFFALAGRGAYIADTASLQGRALTALARRAVAEWVDRAALEGLIASTRGDIVRMAAALARAMQPIGQRTRGPEGRHAQAAA
ncbi:MAG: hypothetical protein KGR68_15590 [Betaproteobacteria bacterium]|nr:hypothetical protein [Betaproteobacteria bacterium]